MKIPLEDFNNSIVLVRVNYDLPSLEKTMRILDSKATIQALLEQGNKVIVLSHWGRPKDYDPKLSLKNIVPVVENILNSKIQFFDQYSMGFESIAQAVRNSTTGLFLLENTRFDSTEQSDDLSKRTALAQQYASLADYFVDEAFPVSHRTEVTNTELKDMLPWSFGISYQNEIKNLDTLKDNPSHPFSILMAGSKLETKLPLITRMIQKADTILLGGQLCFTFIKAAQELGLDNYESLHLGKSHVEEDFLHTARNLLVENEKKFILPVDFVYGDAGGNPVELEKTDQLVYAYDLGEQTISKYKKVLSKSKTIFWNGTLGYYENENYRKATDDIGEFLADQTSVFRVLGGGDTVAALDTKILNRFDFVSMGGGATLEYLAK